MEKHIIIIDLDGTLMLDFSHCEEETIAYLKKLHNEAMKLGSYFHTFRENEELICTQQNPYTDVEKRINRLEATEFDFTTIMDRKGMDALAVDALGLPGLPGAPREGFDPIPMWVADMNFPTVPAVQEAIIARTQHPAFGYFEPREEYYNAIIYKAYNNKKIAIYDTFENDKTFYTDTNVLPETKYTYSIVPYYYNNGRIIFGNEEIITTIKIPLKSTDWWTNEFE